MLAFGFLLLVSLVISTLLNIFSGWAGRWFALETLLRVLNEVVAFLICAALFLALMRMSSGPKPRPPLPGARRVVGATLFTMGRQLLAAYLSTAAVVSAYGAAGSLVVLLMWIYFSSAVLLFGAACAKAWRGCRDRQDAARPRAAARQRAPCAGPAQGQRRGDAHGQQQPQAPGVARLGVHSTPSSSGASARGERRWAAPTRR